jgi:hypothetical protein
VVQDPKGITKLKEKGFDPGFDENTERLNSGAVCLQAQWVHRCTVLGYVVFCLAGRSDSFSTFTGPQYNLPKKLIILEVTIK